MDGMFDPKAIAGGMLAAGPNFVLQSFENVILGVIAAYAVLLLFLGGPSGFFLRLLQMVAVVAGSYYAARGLRYVLCLADAKILGTTEAESTGATSTDAPASSGGKATANSGPKPQTSDPQKMD